MGRSINNPQPLTRVGPDFSFPASGLQVANPEFLDSLDLREDNPYSTGSIINFGDSLSILTRKQLQYAASNTDQYYLVKVDDNIWGISYQYYGSSKYWWVIVDVNNLENGFELPVGSTILIPDLIRLKL